MTNDLFMILHRDKISREVGYVAIDTTKETDVGTWDCQAGAEAILDALIKSGRTHPEYDYRVVGVSLNEAHKAAKKRNDMSEFCRTLWVRNEMH
jgi:hypothetical protein